jgi:hypothetical protein
MCSADFSLEVIDRAVWYGADDFFIKNAHLCFEDEIGRMLEHRCRPRNERVSVSTLPDSTFLRCVGLTEFERRLVNAMFPKYPNQKELAFNLSKSEGYIRKTFSSIYHKFCVNGYAQLARMLTLCSRFSRADGQ